MFALKCRGIYVGQIDWLAQPCMESIGDLGLHKKGDTQLCKQGAKDKSQLETLLPSIRMKVCLATSVADKSQLETLSIHKMDPRSANLFDRPTQRASWG